MRAPPAVGGTNLIPTANQDFSGWSPNQGASVTITQGQLPQVVYGADFYPYGGERAYVSIFPQNYKFEGKERDPETGNDDFGARYYSNRFGRWLSADWSAVPVAVPYANLSNPQTLNLYSMVADDPESFADLDGHSCEHGPPGAGTGPCEQQDEIAEGEAAYTQRVQETIAETDAAKKKAQNQNQDQNQKDKPQDAGVKAPPTDKPPVPPPPGTGPNNEPNEWERVPGTNDKPYGPQFKPKYPVPDTPGGSQPRVWWDPHDGYWSHEPGKPKAPREHFDRWGNRINSQAAVKAATVVTAAVVAYRVWRVVQVILEGAALAGL